MRVWCWLTRGHRWCIDGYVYGVQFRHCSRCYKLDHVSP